LLAGRKLLLADDSATIQKVIDLTFADEGVQVLAVSNGQDAIDQLLDFAPDIVLADVFMPAPDGYEVCRYVKTNEKLKHIPVMLLVGSFEPFDEAEARRVGADDILTKPFSSIRRLIDRVGALVSSPPAEKALVKEGPTAELPHREEPAEDALLSTQEIEVTTADTMPLPDDLVIDTLPGVDRPVASGSVSATPSARLEALLHETQSSARAGMSGSDEKSEHEGRMEPGITETKSDSQSESADVLLDLGDIETSHAHASSSDDDFVLDLDDAPVDDAASMRPFVEPQVTEAPAYEANYAQSSFADTQELAYGSNSSAHESHSSGYGSNSSGYASNESAYEPPSSHVKEIEVHESSAVPPELTPDPVPVFGETEFPVGENSDSPSASPSVAAFSPDQLSPEMIDAIARRCVELMSDKVIREIAWEVVPDLAELLIKKQLEEKQSR